MDLPDPENGTGGLNTTCRVCHEEFPSEQRMRGHCFSEHGLHPEPKGWEYERSQELEDSGWKCRRCNNPSALVGRLHVHHRIPRKYFESEDDSHFYANLKALCASCHATVENVSDSCPSPDCSFSVSSCGRLEVVVDDSVKLEDSESPRVNRAISYRCPRCEQPFDFREWVNDGLNEVEIA